MPDTKTGIRFVVTDRGKKLHIAYLAFNNHIEQKALCGYWCYHWSESHESPPSEKMLCIRCFERAARLGYVNP